MRQLFKYALVFLSIITAVPVQATGQSVPAEAGKKTDSEPVKNEKTYQDLGMWWKRSPLSYDPIPSQFLYHLEAGYSFSRSEGSITKDNHLIKTKITLRKHRFTNIIKYDLDKRNSARADETSVTVNENGNIVIGERNVEIRNSETNELSEHLLFALTKRFYLGGGIEWTKDDVQEIDKRYLYFGGLGCRIIDKPKYYLRLFVGYGYQELKYTDYYNNLFRNLALKYKVLDEFDKGILTSNNYYVSLNARWQATDSLEFLFEADIVGDLEKNEDNRHIWRWDLAAGLQYKIHKYVFLTLNFTETYNKEPATGVRPREQSTDLGIKIEY